MIISCCDVEDKRNVRVRLNESGKLQAELIDKNSVKNIIVTRKIR